jgi:hypothetical protein
MRGLRRIEFDTIREATRIRTGRKLTAEMMPEPRGNGWQQMFLSA